MAAKPATERRETLSWSSFGDAARVLAEQVYADGFRPEVVLSIARGGLFLGAALGYELEVKNLHLVNVVFYTGVDERMAEPVLLPPVPQSVDLAGTRVLVADDVADTGATLELVLGFCAEHAAETRTAVLYEKERSTVRCDYVWRRTDRWIDFPWSSRPPVAAAR